MINFIEAKSPDMNRVTALLELCRATNHWANRGPLYGMLTQKLTEHMTLPPDCTISLCANGGIALESMSRVLGQRAGRPLRWVVSAFSFQNLGRGHFSDVTFVDCTPSGLLDLEQVRALPDESYDGLVVVNPFGLFSDFTAYFDFAKQSGKKLLLDNAAGVNRVIPDWPWQSFSLHHTKPYGMGEGGFSITPNDAGDDVYALLDYGTAPVRPSDWLNNGKLSDISCAFHIDRLEEVKNWVPRYREQAERVRSLAVGLGMDPILQTTCNKPAMSLPFRLPGDVPAANLHKQNQKIIFAKYYKPLAPFTNTLALYARLVNVPTHPDMARISDAGLRQELSKLLPPN